MNIEDIYQDKMIIFKGYTSSRKYFIIWKKIMYYTKNLFTFLEKVRIEKFNKKRFRKEASRREMLLNVLEQIFKRFISYIPLLVE